MKRCSPNIKLFCSNEIIYRVYVQKVNSDNLDISMIIGNIQ